MKKLILIALVIPVPMTLHAQNFDSLYKSYKEAYNGVAIDSLLKQWEAARPEDPALLIAYFNYWSDRSRKEVILTGKDADASYRLHDSSGNPVEETVAKVSYDTSILRLGLNYIDKGITLYPNRLDMRFGKIYMLGESGQYKLFTQEIIRAVDHAGKINYKWRWIDGADLADAKEAFFDAVQGYNATLYNTGNDSLLPYIRDISEAVLKIDNKNVPAYSNIALSYALTGDYNRALGYLQQAEKIAPSDIIVLNNIAEMYRRMKNKAAAIEYYEKIMTYGNADARRMAADRLSELRRHPD